MPARAAGDERELALERAEARRRARRALLRASPGAARLLTGIAFTLRSIRLTRPERTLPGPTSTNVRTPSRTSSRAAWVKRTGAVSWSTSSVPIRCAGSIRAVTVDMNGAVGSVNCTRSTAGRSRSAARATSGQWNAPETFSLTVRRAPSLLGAGAALLDGRVLARDDDLARAVVVRGPDAEDPAAEPLDDLVVEPEDRGHRAGPLRAASAIARPRSRTSAIASPTRHRAGGGQRGELADGVADDEVRLDPALRARRRAWRGSSPRAPAAGPRSRPAPRAASRSRAASGRARTPRSPPRTPPSPRARPRRSRGPCRPRASPGRGSRTRSCSSCAVRPPSTPSS